MDRGEPFGPKQSPAGQLAELFMVLFQDAAAMFRFVSTLEAHAVVARLRTFGMITPGFFRDLSEIRASRAAQIQQVASRWYEPRRPRPGRVLACVAAFGALTGLPILFLDPERESVHELHPGVSP